MIRKRILRAAAVLIGFGALTFLPAAAAAQSGGFAIGGGLGGYSAGKSGGAFKGSARSGGKFGSKFGGKFAGKRFGSKFSGKKFFGRKFAKRSFFGRKSKFARFHHRGRHGHGKYKGGYGIGWGYPFAVPAVIYTSDPDLYTSPPAPVPVQTAEWKLYRAGSDGGCKSENVKVGGGASVTVIRC